MVTVYINWFYCIGLRIIIIMTCERVPIIGACIIILMIRRILDFFGKVNVMSAILIDQICVVEVNITINVYVFNLLRRILVSGYC